MNQELQSLKLSKTNFKESPKHYLVLIYTL